MQIVIYSFSCHMNQHPADGIINFNAELCSLCLDELCIIVNHALKMSDHHNNNTLHSVFKQHYRQTYDFSFLFFASASMM